MIALKDAAGNLLEKIDFKGLVDNKRREHDMHDEGDDAGAAPAKSQRVELFRGGAAFLPV